MLSRITILIVAVALAGVSGAVAQGQLPLDERTAYEHAKEIGTTEAYDAFLRYFPRGYYADLARAARGKLDGLTEPAPTGSGVRSRWDHNGSIMVLEAKGHA